MAQGVWNMRVLAVHPSQQRHGCAAALVARLEAETPALGARLLIAETSGTAAFAAARAFYRRQGYVEEARIRDFWAPDDDKFVFVKPLG